MQIFQTKEGAEPFGCNWTRGVELFYASGAHILIGMCP